MVNGEVLERLWSYLRQFRKMTKEISESHREDILSVALFYLGRKTDIKNRLVNLIKNKLKYIFY